MTESEAIKELQECIDLPFGSNVSDEAAKLAIQALEKQIPMKPKTNRVDSETNNNELIPCKERLPEELEDVLVYFEYFRYGDYNCMYSTYGIGNQYERRWHIDGYGKVNVFAWMPLPKPYKESEE